MTRQLLVLSTIALLLVGLWAVQSGSDSDASVPEPARLEYTVPEDGAADVTLAASHVDGLPGCTELEFATDNVTNGALDPLTDLPCAEGATLTADIDESAAALPVVTTTGFPAAGILRIGDEIVTYTSKTDSSFNGVTRGAAGTNAAPHDAGDTVSQAEEENAPLDMNHNDVETTIVLSGTGLSFPPAGVIQVGNELITYGSAIEVDDTTELGAAVRGAFNTTAAGHLTGDIAYLPPNFATTLTDDIATPQTTIPVASVAGLTAPQGAVAIGDEMISYTGVGITSEDCSPATEPCLTGAARGLGASDPADHSSGDGVFQLSGVDTDAATTTFTLDAEFFGIAGQLSDDIPDTAILVPATAPSSSLVTAFPNDGTVAIDDEVFSYTSIETAAENCDPLPAPCFAGVVRGQQGTAAAAHSAGADIYQAFFSYTAAHEPGAEPSFVGIIATPENDPPTTTDHGAELADANQTLQQLISAQDLDGDSGTHAEGDCELGFTIETEPAAGVIEEITNNDCSSSPPNTDGVPNEDSAIVTYNPDDGFAGEDSFTVRACDDNGCAVSTVTVLVGNVTPTPEPTPTPSPTPPPPTPLPWAHGDIDCDGDVDAVDALAILLVLAGFPPLESDEPDCPTPGDEPPTPAPTPPPTPTPSPTPTPAPTPTDTPTPTPNPSPSATPS